MCACAKPAYLMMPHLAVQPRLVIHCSSPQRCCLYLHKIARHSMQGFASSLSCLAKQELIQGATQDCTYLTQREDTDSIIGRTNERMNEWLACCVPVSEVLAVPLKRWRELNLASVTAVLSAAACSWSPPKGDKGGLRLPVRSIMPP